MTEAQDVQGLEPEGSPPAADAKRGLPSRQVEMEGRSWTIVDLEDGVSWSLYANDPHSRGAAPRLAHITVSEQGYFSTDPAGTVRGPYTTLDEAAYPLALDKQVLLDAPGERAPVDAPVLPVDAGSRSRWRRLLLVAAGAVALTLLASKIGCAQRSRPAS